MLTNSARLIGRVGSEIDFKNDKITVANFSLATKEYFTKNEKSNEITDWHKIVAFDKTAENINKIVGKGDLIEVLGKIKTRSWDDKDGNKRNFDKSNLELISRSENMKRNTIYRYPQPIIDLIRINKKFQRKIRETENA